MMLTTTIREIKAQKPCETRLGVFLKACEGKYTEDDHVPLSFIMEACGFSDTLWVLARVLRRLDIVITFMHDCGERALSVCEKSDYGVAAPSEIVSRAIALANHMARQAAELAAKLAPRAKARAAGAARTLEREWQKSHLLELMESER
jgi:hypothetical protein